MNTTKEEIVHSIKDVDNQVKELESKKRELLKELVLNHCPYKVGQKAKFQRVKTKRTGGCLNPKYEVVSIKDEILVCVAICVCEWGNYNEFRCEFKRLRDNGELTSNLVHVGRDEVEWLDQSDLYVFPDRKK